MNTSLATNQPTTRIYSMQVAPQIAFNEDLFTRFIDYTDVSETTLKGYTVCIRAFMKYLQEHNIRQPKRENIKAYKAYLDSTDRTAGTKQQYLRAVKHFFKWTSAEGLYPNIADNIKGVKVRNDNHRKDAFSVEDVKRILDSIDTTDEIGKRNYTIILLAVTAGLRVFEIQNVNIEDLTTIAGEKVLLIQGKGHSEKDDYKKVVPELESAICDYLSTRENIDKKQPLFTGVGNRAKGKRLTEPSLSHIIKNILVNAGYDSKRLTAHSLRHTSVTFLLKAGATLQEAQHHARHTDPATTGIYAHNINKEEQHPEQKIYDFIFNPESIDLMEQATALLKEMNTEQLKQAIELIKGV